MAELPPPGDEVGEMRGRIHLVGEQLSKRFYPALREVAQAGQQLTRAHQRENAEPAVKEHAIALRSHAMAILDSEFTQSKWVDKFAKLTSATMENCESEKERLKSMRNSFLNHEKDIIKAMRKGRKTATELRLFYEDELRELLEQQLQRYRFFDENHAQIIKLCQQEPAIRHSSAVFSGDGGDDEAERVTEHNVEHSLLNTAGGGEEDEDEEDEQKHLDELYHHAETELRRVEGMHHHQQRQEQAQGQSPATTTMSVEVEVEEHGATVELAAEKEDDEAKVSPNSMWNKNSFCPNDPMVAQLPVVLRKQLTSNIYKPTPLASVFQSGEIRESGQKNQASNLAKEADSHSLGAITAGQPGARRSAPIPPPRDSYAATTAAAVVAEVKTRLHSTPPQIATADHSNSQTPAPRLAGQNLPNRGAVIAGVAPEVPPKNNQPPGGEHPSSLKQTSKEDYVSSPNMPAPASNGQLASGQIQLQEKVHEQKAASPKSIPSPFLASDYGRVLQCITAYTSQSTNQLTLAVGERVVLMKCGTRGWVLGRTEDGQRQGWYPANFLIFGEGVC